MSKIPNVTFNFLAWRERMGWSKDQVQLALGISRTYYWRMEKEHRGTAMAAWAAYGLECYETARKELPTGKDVSNG